MTKENLEKGVVLLSEIENLEARKNDFIGFIDPDPESDNNSFEASIIIIHRKNEKESHRINIDIGLLGLSPNMAVEKILHTLDEKIAFLKQEFDIL